METLPEQFAGALTRIEVGDDKRDRAIAAHTEIRQWLESDPLLVSWGIDTKLIGSYARNTAIHPGKDVDVFAKLGKLDVNASPEEVYDAVRDMLARKYGERAEAQRRSVKVSFDTDGDGFAVDVVPAVPTAEHWAIPQRDRDLWLAADPGARWVETDPEKLGEQTTKLNAGLTIGTKGAYVPTVKLMRQIRHHHLADAKPGGLYFELLTYWAFADGIEGSSFAEVLVASLNAAAARLDEGADLIDPALNKPLGPAPEPEEVMAAARLFSELAAKAAQALESSRCPAAVLWREIVGENERGQCFPLPADCDAEGRELTPISSVVSVGSREPSGFAASRHS